MPRTIVTCDYGDNEHAVREDVHRIGRRILEAAVGTGVGMRRGERHTMGGGPPLGRPR